MKTFPGRGRGAVLRRAFTLIEIMLVVAILALVVGIGIPSFYRSFSHEPMRAAIRGLIDVFSTARAQAILQSKTVNVTFQPLQGTFSVEGAGSPAQPGSATAGRIDDSIGIEMLDVNLSEYRQQDVARVRFFANGTSDECTIVLHSSRNDWRKISLDPITGLATVGDVQ